MLSSRTVLLGIVVALLVGPLPLAATAQPQATIEAELLARLQAGGRSDFFVRMAEQADLAPAYELGWDARGEYVWRVLNEVAQRSQAGVLDYCHQHGLDCTSYVAANAVLVRAGALPTAQDLAALPGVTSLRLERAYELPPAVLESGAGEAPGSSSPGSEDAAEAITPWGLFDTHADRVWARGITGAGIKVATMATGVQWDHPALDQAFACADPADPACWNDPAGTCGGSACDTNGLDTHLMGTMVGDDDPRLTYRAGMAPDAQWIACKGCATAACQEEDLLACADWMLAPDGDPANRPHVVLNGWGSGSSDVWFRANVQAWRAAGIFPAFDTGTGGACDSLSSPGDYQESMDTTGHDSERTVLSIAGGGPSVFGHDPYTKPNLSAPGASICSSVPTDGWSCGYTAATMASAHTAGAVALVWQACPAYLGDVNATMDLLQSTADPPPAGDCGAPPDGEGNYTYGYGYLNVLRAVEPCTVEIETWTEVGPLCFDLYSFDGYYHPVTDKAYFLGGRMGDGTYGDIYSFDPATGVCEDTGDDMPVPISNYVVVPYTDRGTTWLCTVGGLDATGANIIDVQCYDPVSHASDTVSTVPKALAGWQIGGAEVVKNRVYVFGGLRWSPSRAATDVTFEWDPATDTWTQMGNMGLARGNIISAVVDGQIYAFGGDVFDGSLLAPRSIAERFDPKVGTWSDVAVADLPSPLGEGRAHGFSSSSGTTVSGQVVLAGGGQWPAQTAEALVYDVVSDSYDPDFPDLNVSRRLHASFFDVDMARLWVVGGRSMDPGYGGNDPPYAPAEYVDLVVRVYLPLVLRSWTP